MSTSGRGDEFRFGLFGFIFAVFILLKVLTSQPCHLELFVDSVSVSAVGWNVSMVARSTPLTGCDISITPLNFRLLLGDKVIAESVAMDASRNLPHERPATDLTTTMMDKLDDSGGDVVYWDARIELLARVWKSGGKRNIGTRNNGFLSVTCDNLPVRFWSDREGNRKGLLL